MVVCATLEVISSIYQHVLIHTIQLPAPPSELPLKQRYQLLLKVLGADVVAANDEHEDLEHEEAEGIEEVVDEAKGAKRDLVEEEELVARLLCPDEQPPSGLKREREEGGTSRDVRRKDSGIGTPVTTLSKLEPLSDIVLPLARLLDEDGKPVKLDVADPRAVQLRERLRTW